MFGKGQCGGMGHHGWGGHFGGFGGGHEGGKCGPGALLSGLSLTDEQLLKLAELKGKSCSQIARAKVDLMELKKGVFKELLQAQVDKAKVQAIAAQIKEQKSKCMDGILENVIAFSELLTADQKAKLRINLVRKFLGVDEFEELD